MELKKGYKHTDIGIIPNDWDVKRLAQCCSKITDGTHDTPKPIKTGVPFLTAIHVKENHIDFASCYFLPQNVHEIIYRRCNPEKNDVLMVNIGAGVATTALVSVEYEFSLKNVALLKPNNSVLKGQFLNYYQEFVKERVVSSISTGGAQPFLSLTQIGELQIALPTIDEQTAIVAVLSDTGELINELEQIIAKKRNIKQGTMQDLLTGKKRLKGFSGEWKERKLEDLADFLKGRGLSKGEIVNDGNRPCILYGELFTTYSEVINKMESRTNSKEGLPSMNGDILLPGSTTTVGIDLAIAASLRQNDVLIGGDIIVIRKRGTLSYNSEFLANYLTHISKYKIAEITQGITIIHLHGSRLKKIFVKIPTNINEQNAIANILCDIDAEIEQLEQQLAKFKQIKQGMMQELLTGKIRLM